MPVSDAQLKATGRYHAKLEQVRVWVPKGNRYRYKSFAASRGMSLNSMVVALLEQAISGDIPLPPPGVLAQPVPPADSDSPDT